MHIMMQVYFMDVKISNKNYWRKSALHTIRGMTLVRPLYDIESTYIRI